MPRVAGVDIPRNKQVWVSLQYIYGIGATTSRRILSQTGITPEVKVSDLTDDEVNKLREAIDHDYRVEGDLRKEIDLNIKRLIEIGSYRGMRHRRGLPLRGQRTRTNARAKRGPRKTVAGRGQKRGATKK
jgi:small subunit ribosomal protein S13